MHACVCVCVCVCVFVCMCVCVRVYNSIINPSCPATHHMPKCVYVYSTSTCKWMCVYTVVVRCMVVVYVMWSEWENIFVYAHV